MTLSSPEQRPLVIAFDPGSKTCGHAEIIPLGQDRYKVLGLGAISVKGRVHFRLGWLYEEIEKLLLPYRGQDVEVVVEKHFIGPGAFGTITLAESRGVILAAVARAGFQRVFDYAPNTAKKAVTGNGRADKYMVCNSIKAILNLQEDPLLDASDAAALALCHIFRKNQI